MPYVLAVAIGPVQEFIAAARKTRDLWFGSHMLSEICRATAKALHRSGAELVFPPPTAVTDSQQGDRPAVANKIVAVLPDGLPPDELTGKARDAALDKLWSYGQQALTRARDIVDEAAVDSQLSDFLEFYSAWYPMSNDSGYEVALTQADLLLAGRKALRDFNQSNETEGRPKSSLDGGRQTVLVEKKRQSWPRFGIKEGEQLDAISVIKRVVSAEIRRFVSVGRVAVDPYVRRLKAEEPLVLDKLIRIAEELVQMDCPTVTKFDPNALPQYADFPYDCLLFYATRETDKELDDWCKSNQQGAQLVESFAKLLDGKPEPPAYLAVLHADGDRMGAAIRHLKTPDEHRKLSAALVKFAGRANEIVTRHHGALVYSGGDDVLAFLPLDEALECAKDLSEAFKDCVKYVFEGTASASPTLSVGISINHHGEHLGEMVEWSRMAERAAKKQRNSLAVALHTRTAGEEAVTVTRKWNERPGPVETLQLWTTLHRMDALPDRVPFELRELHRELASYSQTLSEAERQAKLSEILTDEVKRILKRKRGEHGKAELLKEVYEGVVLHVG
ncbi:MAG: type III-B CRISPR-associated protein Cas10/Cmr2, partial [Armatimonadota bacterium]